MNMSQFKFTIKTNTHTYKYEGTLESLSRHLEANAHLQPEVVESETQFSSPD